MRPTSLSLLRCMWCCSQPGGGDYLHTGLIVGDRHVRHPQHHHTQITCLHFQDLQEMLISTSSAVRKSNQSTLTLVSYPLSTCRKRQRRRPRRPPTSRYVHKDSIMANRKLTSNRKRNSSLARAKRQPRTQQTRASRRDVGGNWQGEPSLETKSSHSLSYRSSFSKAPRSCATDSS